MAARENDPYKKVWDTVEDHEAALNEAADSGCLFVPTYEELGRRHVAKAKYLLARARRLGSTLEGIATFDEALLERDFASQMFKRHQDSLKAG